MQASLLIPLALAFFSFPLQAADNAQTLPKFELPIDCEFPKGCYIQSYVDLDPSEGTIDYQCGVHTYNGHKGTDFRLRRLSMLEKGVRVLAAAPGRVARIRDGMPDTHMKVFGKKVLSRFGAGNAVVIDHGNKWVTLYAHLKKGSIRVRPGDIVKAGQTLGLVGLSGLTEFPHLHFQISHQDRIVDAFVGSRPSVGCPSDRQPMWSATALKKIGYQRSFVMEAGFSDQPLNREALLFGVGVKQQLPQKAPNLVFNIDFAGLRKGDIYELRILDPSGTIFAESRKTAENNAAVRFLYTGKKRAKRPAWPTGVYIGQFTLMRRSGTKMKVFARHETTLTVR